MDYATKEELAAWLGYETAEGDPNVNLLPDNVDKTIRNASRVIEHATMGQVDQNNPKQLAIASRATCAQCEYWLDGVGESTDINPGVAGYTAGKFTIQFNGGSLPKLAPRARRELWLGGLLNRRVTSL
jgi:hypothetical protein